MEADQLSTSYINCLKTGTVPTETIRADPDLDEAFLSNKDMEPNSKGKDINEEVQEKMERLCRTCLVEGGSEVMRGLFSMGDPPTTREYHEMITSCTGISIAEDDGLPRQLCIMCANEVSSLFTFKKKCAKVDVCLRKLLRNPNEKGLEDLVELSRLGDIEKDLFFVNTEDSDTSKNHNKKRKAMSSPENTKTSPDTLGYSVDSSVAMAVSENTCLLSKNLDKDPVSSLKRKLNQFDEYDDTDDEEMNMPISSYDPLTFLTNKKSGKRKITAEVLEKEKNLEPVVPFACRKCEMHFLSFDELCKHSVTHPQITDDLKLVCRYCDETFSYQRLVIPHIRSAHADLARFQCGYCGEKWKVFTDLKEHLVNHSSGDAFYRNADRRVKEEMCSDEDDDDDDYTLDNFVSCAQSNQSESENSTSPLKKMKNSNSKQIKKSNKLKCHICKRVFEGQETLQAHLLEEHGLEDSNLENNSEKLSLDNSTVKLENYSSPNAPNGVIPKAKRVKKAIKAIGKPKKTNKKQAGRGKGNYSCKMCDRSFKTQEDITRHSATHDPNKPHRCQFGMCRWSFKTEFDLLVHTNIYHSEGKNNECTVCRKSFKHSQNLRQHMMTHRPTKRYKCNHCGKGFTHLQHLKSHERLHRPDLQPFLCTECGNPFLTKDRLKYHMKIHSDKTLTCDICVKTFSSITGYNYHLKIHSGERPHMCQICGKTFKIPSELKKHTLNIHERVKPKGVSENHPMMCKVCGDVKNSVPELTQHMKIHTSQHFCPLCPKNFSLEKNLVLHMRTHPLGTRSFVCGKCNSAYNTRSCLFTHEIRCLKTREFLPCTYCDKTFATKPELVHHTRTHTGEKPFVCNECGRAFARNGTLQGHIRTHTGERPFECRVCDRAFCTTGALRFHMKSHFTLLQEDEILSKISSGELKLTADTSKPGNTIKWEPVKPVGDACILTEHENILEYKKELAIESKNSIVSNEIDTIEQDVEKEVNQSFIVIPPSAELQSQVVEQELHAPRKKNSIVLHQLGSSGQGIIVEIFDDRNHDIEEAIMS